MRAVHVHVCTTAAFCVLRGSVSSFRVCVCVCVCVCVSQEHSVYPEAVSALVDKRITWREDGIPILWSAH